MSSNRQIYSYSSQVSVSSFALNEKESMSLTTQNLRKTLQFGPIQVRVCRKPAPTIATGRRSKHLILEGHDAVKREKRRERNREAARKLKERRQIIEEQLSQEVNRLETEHSRLKSNLECLRQIKTNLQNQLNRISNDPIEKLLKDECRQGPLFFEQNFADLDNVDYWLDDILTHDIKIEADSFSNS